MNGNFKKAKKVLAALLGTFMLLEGAAIGISAADIDPAAEVYVRPTVETLECEQIGANYVYLNITTENTDTDYPIIAYFLSGSSNLHTLAYTGVRDDSANIKLGVPDSVPTGTYAIVVALNRAGETAETDFFYVGVEDVLGFYDALNLTDVDVSEVRAALDSYSVALSVIQYTAAENGKKIALSGETYENLTSAQKDAFAELLLSGVNGKFSDQKGSFDALNSEQFIKEALVLSIYNSDEVLASDLVDALYTYDTTIGFNSEDQTLYGKIEDRETLGKVIKNMAPTAESVEELATVIANAAGVELINETHWANLVDAIAARNDLFGVDEAQITKLQNNKNLRNTFCQLLNKIYYSVDEIREAWDSAYNEAVKSTASSSSGGGGGSSSSSSSSGSATSVAVGTSLINTNDTLGVKKTITDYYTDMGNYAWASDYVLNLTEAGVVSGYGDKTFGPGNNLTRAEFMKMLVNACGLADVTATSSFTDVEKDAWYYVYVASAEKLGLATGYGNGLFGVNDPITREDMVTLIYRAAKLKGLPFEKYSIGALTFEDKDQISSYATDAVKALYGAGLYLDTSDNSKLTTFEPKSYASRAYVAVVLDQIYNLK